MIAILPVAIAFDFGGVLWWSQYIVSLTAFLVVLLTLPALLERRLPRGRSFLIVVPLIFWCGFALWQSASVSPELVEKVSAGTATAYQRWSEPLLDNLEPDRVDMDGGTIPLSIDPTNTRHFAWLAVSLIPIVACGIIVFRLPRQTEILLLTIAGVISLHVVYAIWCQVFPQHSVRVIDPDAVDLGFGSFINRNNAALHLNLGLATGVGLIAWVLNSRERHRLAPEVFDIADFVRLLTGKLSLFALVSVALCFAGLLACGSRSGMLACMAGLIALACLLRSRKGLVLAAVFLCISGVLAWLLLSPGDESTTLDRLSEINLKSGEGLSGNARWAHWNDSLRAAAAYAPLGSGLSTYAYAYLPFQSKGSDYWFHHADNLYLELLVEQGFVGYVLAITVVCFVIRDLRVLGRSNAPVDRGLYVAMIFALVSIAVSQIFDFGLILPSNLFCLAAFAAAVRARSAALSRGADSDIPTRVRLAFYAPVSIVALMASVFAAQNLNADAHSVTDLRAAEVEFGQNKHHLSATRALADRLAEHVRMKPSPDVCDFASLVQFQAARLEELDSFGITKPEDYAKAYASSNLLSRRREWREPQVLSIERAGIAPSNFGQSLASATHSLRLRPLGLKPRSMFIYLDFVHRDTELTAQSLNQLAVLQQRSPEQLIRIGKLASDSGEDTLAVKSLRSAQVLRPRLTEVVVDYAIENPKIDLADVIPESAANQQLATGLVLNKTADDDPLSSEARQFFQQSVSHLDCESVVSHQLRSHCLQLLARTHFRLQQDASGVTALKEAVELYPANYATRITLIEKLRELGEFDDALAEAEKGQTLFPDNQRFRAFIRAISAERIRQSSSSDESR